MEIAMKRTHLFLLALCLGTAMSVAAQTTPIDVEIGFRWADVSGNEDMYRTQIDEENGLLLRALTLSSIDFEGHARFMDQFRVDVDDFGEGSPESSLRMQFGLANAYRFNLRYRKAVNFSALPGLANPLLGSGVIPGQHTFDRDRNTIDADLELLRWSRFKPFIGYSWNRYEGPGTTTWHIGQDEFLLDQDLEDTDREIRIGTGFDLGPVSGAITQGWRSFRGHESLTLAPGANNGNNSNPVLGTPINVSALTREERTDVDTPFTSFYATGTVFSKIRLVGNYARFTAETDSVGDDAATGSLASFALSRFFKGLTETSSARANNTTWRGGLRGEMAFGDKVDVTAGYRADHRELDGSALIRTLYLQSVTFGGADPRDVETILNAENALEREEKVIDASVALHPATGLSMRVGVARSDMDVTVTPDLSEIVVPGNQGGSFERVVRTFLLDTNFTRNGFVIGASAQRDNADDPILRTDFTDRDRYRIRAGWKAPRFFRAMLTADKTDQSNPSLDTAYDATLRQYTADFEVTPFSMLALRASTSRFRSDSTILIRRPENFTTTTSLHVEKGKSIETGLTFSWSRFSLDGDTSRFENEGSLPFDLDRTRLRATMQVHENFGVAAEWARDTYSETNFALADYQGTRYGLFLTLRR
jgi:hypothetical protein